MNETWLEKAVFLIIGWLATWGVWVSLYLQRLSKDSLTRSDHQAICDRQNGQINERLEKIERIIESDRRESQAHRETLSNNIATLIERTNPPKNRRPRG